MTEVQRYSLKEELDKIDQELQDSTSLFGMSALTFPSYINSMRAVMFCSHLNQFLTPINPDFPYVFTNVENIVGKYSDGYKQVKNKSTVYKKIVKFDGLIENPNTYTMFLFDEKEKKYFVVMRSELADLTENFGYNYNNEVIDSLKEGDKVKAKDVLYKSTSYDEDMNYAYGKNIPVMYTLDPYTSEDAVVVSDELANDFLTIETEVIDIKLNDNDYLLNLYGKNGDYKPIPDIGEKVTGVLGAIRTQFNNQLLYDFKEDNLTKIKDGDRTIYVNGTVEVVDLTIFSNNEEIVDNSFNNQLNGYLRSQNEYYQEIYDTCEEIINSGYEYSQEIDYLYKRSGEMIDTQKKWKEGDSACSNMYVSVVIRKVKTLTPGQKISG